MTYVFSGGRLEYWVSVAVIEALVLAIEYLLCLAYTRNQIKSIKYSLVCNAVSYFIGSLIIMIF